MRPLLAGVTAVLFTTTLASCSTMQDDKVRETATQFYAAYANDKGDAACDELAPKTRSELEQSAGGSCSEVLLEEKFPKVSRPTKVRVFGTQAQVTWRGETTFLARFQGGWKVMAAACTKQPDHPYDCKVSGG